MIIVHDGFLDSCFFRLSKIDATSSVVCFSFNFSEFFFWSVDKHGFWMKLINFFVDCSNIFFGYEDIVVVEWYFDGLGRLDVVLFDNLDLFG